MVESVKATDIDAAAILGSAIERREDPALLTGEAEYTDDIRLPGMVHVAIKRSQHAHARIVDIDTSAAAAMDGVVDVFTAADLDVPGLLPVGWLHETLKQVDRPLLASERVRYLGDPLAVVVAEDRYRAHDAVERIAVTYERLDTVTDPTEALDGDAPVLHESAGDNTAFVWELGDETATNDAFAEADHVVSLDLENQLLIPNAMEPRAAVAEYAPSDDELTVHMTSQNPHVHRLLMASVLGHPEHKLRVRAPDVGGGFGSKAMQYADELLTAVAAKRTRRPTKWQATRTESYLTDAQGRGHKTHAEMAVDDDGTIRGLRVTTDANMGAYLSTFAPAVPTYLYATLLSGQYDIPAIHCAVRGAFTNVPPVDAYRGAGRPEASFVVERLADLAARELGIDPAEFRRQNFVREFPHQTPVAVVYDSGDYEKPLDRALELVDYEAFRERQERLRDEGRYLGIGLSAYIEACGLAPSKLAGQLGSQVGFWESSLVRFHPSGTVTAYCGTSGHGQGHETTYAQIVATELGVDYDDVEVVEGDTDEIPHGMGTYGSRSAAVGGSSLVVSSQKLVDKARTIAAHQLEASADDIEFDQGEFRLKGAPDRSVTIQAVAQQAYLAHDLPDGMEPGLEATSFYDPENFVFPFGIHAAVVEVDPDSGEVSFEKYVAVDDVGNQINPKIVEGQIHGGVAQGIGQALYEGAVYDENGQLVTGSMMDYAVPKSVHIPTLTTDSTVTPTPVNPLGVKGVGEAGTIAAPQAVVNAVCDALAPLGVTHIDMPMTGESVWRAISSSNAAVTDGGER